MIRSFLHIFVVAALSMTALSSFAFAADPAPDKKAEAAKVDESKADDAAAKDAEKEADDEDAYTPPTKADKKPITSRRLNRPICLRSARRSCWMRNSMARRINPIS